MRYSRAFIPTVKEVPKEATMPSHGLMLPLWVIWWQLSKPALIVS